MSKHFHNTTSESGTTLATYNDKALSLEVRVIDYMKMTYRLHSGFMPYKSPSQVYRSMDLEKEGVPITSLRRAMSNLTRDGVLFKTEHKVIGMYGRPEFMWGLNASYLMLHDQ